MSYDIVVFDPASAPHDPSALRAWLDDEVRAAPSSPMVARASELLQRFYRPLSEAPEVLEPGEHFADYSAAGGELYISVPWHDAEDVTAVVHRLAAENGWGFWDVSVTDGTIWRPDPAGQPSNVPIADTALTIDNGGVHGDPSPALIAASIEWIADQHGPSFAIFERGGDDYVQYAGGREGVTVEMRVPASTEPGFRHLIAATSSDTEGDSVDLPGATRSFRVRSNEVLASADATALVLALAMEKTPPPSLFWHDITGMFAS